MIASKNNKVIVIVGPTAIGKTSLSIDMGQMLETEIVSADSRQVYIGLDIGSGKITQEEMQGVPHHLLDVADPKDVFTASDYLRLGKQAIKHIHNKGKVPIIIGGTGFYIDVLLEKVSLTEVPPNAALRKTLEKFNLSELQERLRDIDPDALERMDTENPRRLIRAIEIAQVLGKVPPLKERSDLYNTLWIGLEIPIPSLREKIHERLVLRMKTGMLEEAKNLYKEGLSYERMEELGLEYRSMARHLKGDISYEEMMTEIETESVKYARRQMTWFKKNKEIHWFSPDEKEKALELAKAFIN